MKKKIIAAAAAVIILVLVGASLVVTNENEYTLVRQFGKISRVIDEPGLTMKIPFIQTTDTCPKETLLYDLTPSEVITKDKKTMITDSYVLWRVIDPMKFAQSLNGSVMNAESRINTAVYNALKNAISSMNQDEVINSRDIELSVLVMNSIDDNMEQYGIELTLFETKQLDLPVELAMLENVVNGDGGDFSQVTLIPNDITDEPAALAAGQTDAVWVFEGWSYMMSLIEGIDCDYFGFAEINPVFDYYTPVIIANNDYLEANPQQAKAFLAATAKGYAYAQEYPQEAAEMLIAGDNTGSLRGAEELVKKSQEFLSANYTADAEAWGYIDPERWNGFYGWLYENGLCEKDLTGIGFSNEYLPQ